MVEATDDRDDEQDEYYDATVHPVDEDKEQYGCSTYPPEFPQQEGEHSAECLGRTESHVSIRR